MCIPNGRGGTGTADDAVVLRKTRRTRDQRVRRRWLEGNKADILCSLSNVAALVLLPMQPASSLYMNISTRLFHAARPAIHSDRSKEARHLLRAILRECTYLPDVDARVAIKQQVLHTFRSTQRKLPAFDELDVSESTPQNDSIPPRGDAERKISNWLNKGYKGLRFLQRANEGELRPLAKVLHYTYGRGGPRRHELLRPLLTPDAVIADSKSLEEHLKNIQDRQIPTMWTLATVPVPAPDVFDVPVLKGDVLEYQISNRYGKLKALLYSQSKSDLPEPPGRPIARIKSHLCKLPAKNTWGRSMPRKRVKNMVRDWYNLVISRLLPPLPEHEWNRLQEKINGTIKWDGAPQRRGRPIMKPKTLTTFDLEKLLRYVEASGTAQTPLEVAHTAFPRSLDECGDLTQITAVMRSRFRDDASIRWLASQTLRNDSMQDILKDSIGAIRQLNKALPRQRGHFITHRLMKRLWTQVFSISPMMSKSESDQWKVTWGTVPTTYKTVPTQDSFLPLFPAAQIPNDNSGISENEIPAA